MDWSELADVGNVFQAFGLIAVGLWVVFRFLKERTHYPHVEFSVDCNLYGPDDKQYVAEFLFRVKNRGFVQQKLKDIFLSAHAIDEKDPKLIKWKEIENMKRGSSYNDRLYCPIPVIKKVDIIPPSYKPYVVEPNCEEVIRYITPIPMNLKYMAIHAEYWYPKTDEEETEEKGKAPKWWYGYPRHPRTAERFIKVEARVA